MKGERTSGGLSIRSDFHMHTNFPTDSQAVWAVMLEPGGKRAGCGDITDHMDLGFPAGGAKSRPGDAVPV